MALRDSDDPQAFKIIAAQAGGDYTTQGSAPADAQEMWFPDGWVGYVNKDDARTRRHLREALGLEPDARVPLYSATDDIRALAKELHQEARRAAQVARKRPIAVEVPQPTPEAAAPVSESLDAPAPASRSCSRPTTMPTTPLPIPAVAIRVPAIVLGATWKASTGVSLPTLARNSWPMPTRAPLPVLAVQVVPIATEDRFRLPADARSRGPPWRSARRPLRLLLGLECVGERVDQGGLFSGEFEHPDPVPPAEDVQGVREPLVALLFGDMSHLGALAR